MTQAIHATNNPSPLLRQREEPRSLAARVGALALAALGALFSFVYLPWQGALLASAGLGILLTHWWSSSPTTSVAVQPQPVNPLLNNFVGRIRDWNRPIIDNRNLVPRFLEQQALIQPVVNPGPRVPVGGVQNAIPVAVPAPIPAFAAPPFAAAPPPEVRLATLPPLLANSPVVFAAQNSDPASTRRGGRTPASRLSTTGSPPFSGPTASLSRVPVGRRETPPATLPVQSSLAPMPTNQGSFMPAVTREARQPSDTTSSNSSSRVPVGRRNNNQS